MDWQKILKCYIEHVMSHESTSFIEHKADKNDLVAPGFYKFPLTEDEYAALLEISQEIKP
jgi:hypothetical protein